MLRFIAHTALAGIFISGGLAAARDPKPLAQVAKPTIDRLGDQVASATGNTCLHQCGPERVVRYNGVAQILGGVALITGVGRKPAALGLIASLIPTTIAGHPFWAMKGSARAKQEVQFAKNLGLLGGLLLVATEPKKESWCRRLRNRMVGVFTPGRPYPLELERP